MIYYQEYFAGERDSFENYMFRDEFSNAENLNEESRQLEFNRFWFLLRTVRLKTLCKLFKMLLKIHSSNFSYI